MINKYDMNVSSILDMKRTCAQMAGRRIFDARTIPLTFANGLNEDGIVASDDETETSLVSVDYHPPRVWIGVGCVIAANQDAVDGRRAVLRRRDPLQLWRTSLESGPVRLVQPGTVERSENIE